MALGESVDLLVVGGGPAGAAAAITARAQGLSVVLVERELHPAAHPGETLHPGLEPLLDRLGLGDEVRAAGFVRPRGQHVQWGEAPLRFVAYGEDERGPWRGFQAVRPQLDTIFLQRAQAVGADVRRGVEVQQALRDDDALRGWTVCGGSTGASEIRAAWCIDATGRRQRFAEALALDPVVRSRRLVVRYGWVRGRVPDIDDAPVLAGDADGWTWIARVEAERYAWAHLALRRASPQRGWMPPRLAACTAQGPSHGADVTWRRAQSLAGDGWMLAGDAGAVVDPAAGHGVLRAVMTGMNAAHLAAAAVQGRASAERVAAEFDRFATGWFEHDIDVLQGFYAELGVSVAPLARGRRTQRPMLPRSS